MCLFCFREGLWSLTARSWRLEALSQIEVPFPPSQCKYFRFVSCHIESMLNVILGFVIFSFFFFFVTFFCHIFCRVFLVVFFNSLFFSSLS